MRTTYTCEICGKEFIEFDQCLTHEKICREAHATGIRLTKDLCKILRQAQAAGMPIVTGCVHDDIALEYIGYDADKKHIYLEFTD